VEQRCRPYLAAVYNELRAEVDGYAMDMAALLLKERRWDVLPEGRIDIPPRIKKFCERRRMRIHQLVGQLLDPDAAPVFDEARRYGQVETFAERKALIHRRERAVQEEAALSARANTWSFGDPARCRDSDWDFDRIVYYLVQEHAAEVDPEDLLRCIRQEHERLEASVENRSLIPIHYASRALSKTLRQRPVDAIFADDAEALIKRIEDYVQQKPTRDAQGQLRRNLNELHALLKPRTPGEKPR
jgi:hypothetical protein